MDKLISLCKRRGFIYPSSEIYGGITGIWDYGPLGVELKRNIKKEWWKSMVQLREDVVGIDASVIMNPKVWEASGHIEAFVDPLIECKNCHERFRADHIKDLTCPSCQTKDSFTPQKMFNLMLKAGKNNVGKLEWDKLIKQQKSGGDNPVLAAKLCLWLSGSSNKITGKTISAIYDDWSRWTDKTLDIISSNDWYTMRRIDQYTLDKLEKI